MDTRLLRLFCAVARQDSVGAAARELHLTPSAISHGLKKLETQLGCRVFDRAGKRLLLNQAGEQLLSAIQEPLAKLDAVQESMKRLSQWGQTRLRIGAPASACQYLLPQTICELKKKYPNLNLQVESGDMPEMIELIRQNRIDLALGVQPENAVDLQTRRIFQDELLFALSPSHSWAGNRPLSSQDLRTQPLILYQRKSFTALLVKRYFQRLGIVPATVMEIASIEAIKELVQLKLGVSVLAPWTADKELARGKLMMRPLGTRPLKRVWVIASFPGRRLTLAEETFCQVCRSIAAGLRLDRRDLPK